MVKEYSSIIGTPVLHYEDGALLAAVQDVIVDTDTGKIEGVWVKPLTLPIADAVIQVQDITEWKKNIYIKNESVISEPADIIKITDILSKNTVVIGNSVKNQEGKNYGKVFDLTFDAGSYYIRQIYVQKSILGFINFDKRILAYDTIIEILQDAIIIDDKTAQKEKVVEAGFVKNTSPDAIS